MTSETNENLRLLLHVIFFLLVVIIVVFLLIRLLSLYSYYHNNLDGYCKLKYGDSYFGASTDRSFPEGMSKCVYINEKGSIVEYYSSLTQYQSLCKPPKFLDFKYWSDICYDNQILNIQSQIDNLPKKVCWNETEIITYQYELVKSIYSNSNCFNLSFDIICEKNYEIVEEGDLKCVYPTNWGNLRNSDFINGIFIEKCLIKSTKEVCEIK